MIAIAHLLASLSRLGGSLARICMSYRFDVTRARVCASAGVRVTHEQRMQNKADEASTVGSIELGERSNQSLNVRSALGNVSA